MPVVTRSAAALNAQSSSQANLESLPEEVIAQILRGIPRSELKNVRLSRRLDEVINKWFGLTLTLNGSQGRRRIPISLWEGQTTVLVLKNYTSANPHHLPPLPRLRELKIEGKMRLSTTWSILEQASNLRALSITSPIILDLGFIPTSSDDQLCERITSIVAILKNDQTLWGPQIAIPTEQGLLRIISKMSLSALEEFSFKYDVKKHEIQPITAPDELSQLIKIIIAKSGATLKTLWLSRPYDWNLDGGIQAFPHLKVLHLSWMGPSNWIKELLNVQGGLTLLDVRCFQKTWIDGAVQMSAFNSKESLRELAVVICFENTEFDFNLSFLAECSKLKILRVQSARDFELTSGLRTLPNPPQVAPLPSSLMHLTLQGPMSFQAFNLSLSNLPNLETVSLLRFKWVDWPSVINAILQVEMEPLSFCCLLNWPWVRELIKKSPRLKTIHFRECIGDFFGMANHLRNVEGVMLGGLRLDQMLVPFLGDQGLSLYTWNIWVNRSKFNPENLCNCLCLQNP